jgi:NADH:ubiquinone oxidoreductase subunit 5 (subunit L)/multisubunit Na+/H+ antiporter MnhA subunit
VKYVGEAVTIIAAASNVAITYFLFGKAAAFTIPWAGLGIEFSLRLDHLSSFIIASASTFAFLIALYCLSFMREKDNSKLFNLYLLITLSFVTGAVLSDNLVLMLFFWEGLLATLFGFIFIGGKSSFPTAIKAFIITGVADLCFLLGVALTGHLAGTLPCQRSCFRLGQEGRRRSHF